MNLYRKRVTVLGAARSGRAAANLALSKGAEVTLTDLKADARPMEGVHCVFGRHDDQDLDADVVVVSPGVPERAPPVQKALANGATVVSELAFAWEFIPHDRPLIAITGTNGKSTVTEFTAQLLRAAGLDTFAGGNLGTPLSAAAANCTFDAYVVEVSSYQMELPGQFTPSVATVLNLTPDHLKRHGTMACYAEHKCRVFDRMGDGGFAVLPADNPVLLQAAEGRPGRRLWIGQQPGVVLEGEGAWVGDAFVDLSGFGVLGEHNRLNAGVACLLAHGAGLSIDQLKPSALRGLPHRMERVQTDDGLIWVNDSKATNVAAALTGLSGLGQPAIVLLGGQGKDGADYASLKPHLQRGCVTFGASGPDIASVLNGQVLAQAPDLETAVDLARKAAQPGDAVVLSPACASFDEFDNFEQRGDVFRALARGFAPRKTS